MEGEHAHMQQISCKMEGEHAKMWQIPYKMEGEHATCRKSHAKWKVNMPNVANTMQKDAKFKFQTVASITPNPPNRFLSKPKLPHL